jgi:hypothetical protein
MRHKLSKDGANSIGPRHSKRKKIWFFTWLILVLLSINPTSNAQSCNAGEYYDSTNAYCVPCQVDTDCSGGTIPLACSTTTQFAPSRNTAGGCLPIAADNEIVAGISYSCPSNMYSTSGAWLTTLASACPVGKIGTDGTCQTKPAGISVIADDDFTRLMIGFEAVVAGDYIDTAILDSPCPVGEMCVNGIKTTCTGTTWAELGSTGCNTCIPNHHCDETPTACVDGKYLPTLVSATDTCEDCTEGYICKEKWYGQVKVFPGTHAVANESSWTDCPEGKSCSDTGTTANCAANKYSSLGDYDCNDSPEWLRFTGIQSHIFMSKFDIETIIVTGTPDVKSYNPGNGKEYLLYEGLDTDTSTATIRPLAAGEDCEDNFSSNGGSACTDCDENFSDRSQCQDGTSPTSYTNTQFARGFRNLEYQREKDDLAWLLSSSASGTNATVSGSAGLSCNPEGTYDGTSPVQGRSYIQSQCDGARDDNGDRYFDANGDIDIIKSKHSTQPYKVCSWCPNDIQCEYHNSFFTFYRGFMINCPFGEYSANGDLECHRRNSDPTKFCQIGYYRAIESFDKVDEWVHDQDKIYECVPVNKSPTDASYIAEDSKYSPDCGPGEFLRYGIEGCAANAPGFFNSENEASDTATKCTDGYYCRPDRESTSDISTAQFSCPKGSSGTSDGAYSEYEQCDLCSEGKYCPEGTGSAGEIACEQGYYWPTGTSDKLQFTCGPGFYGASGGARFFSDQCTMCAAGEYCQASVTAGSACAAGHYCFVYSGDQYQTPVMPGKYISAATGLLSGATICEVGKYCPAGSTVAIDCPTGTSTSDPGMGEIMNCGACSAGTACPTEGSSGATVACSVGHYWPAGTKNPYDYPCPAGSFTDLTNLGSAAGCTDCPAGSACLIMTSTTATAISKIPILLLDSK